MFRNLYDIFSKKNKFITTFEEKRYNELSFDSITSNKKNEISLRNKLSIFRAKLKFFRPINTNKKELLYKKETLNRKMPELNKKEDSKYFNNEKTKNLKATYLWKLKEIIINKAGVIIVNNKIFIPSVHSKTMLDKYDLEKTYLHTKIVKFHSTNKIAIIHTLYTSNYCHWLTDALPRLIYLLKNNYVIDLVLPSCHKKNYIIDSLKLLGFNRILWLKSEESAHIKNVLMIEPTSSMGNQRPDLLKEIRDKLIEKLNLRPVLPQRKIYVSRKFSDKRKIINEEQLINVLKENGFEILHLEDFSFSKQVEIFYETKIFITNHGAALTNLMFMQPNTKILELRRENDYKNNVFYSMTSDLNMNYNYLICKSNIKETYYGDLNVSISKFRDKIKNLSHE